MSSGFALDQRSEKFIRRFILTLPPDLADLDAQRPRMMYASEPSVLLEAECEVLLVALASLISFES